MLITPGSQRVNNLKERGKCKNQHIHVVQSIFTNNLKDSLLEFDNDLHVYLTAIFSRKFHNN